MNKINTTDISKNIIEAEINLDPSKKEDVELVNLMLAFNDLKTSFYKLSSFEEEKDLFKNGRIYYARILIGHTYELIKAFHRFVIKTDKFILEKFPSKKLEDYKKLKKFSDNNSSGSFFKKIEKVRDEVCFHYLSTPVEKPLSEIQNVMPDLAKKITLGNLRYTWFDMAEEVRIKIFSNIISQENGSLEDFMKQVNEILGLLYPIIIDYIFHAGKCETHNL